MGAREEALEVKSYLDRQDRAGALESMVEEFQRMSVSEFREFLRQTEQVTRGNENGSLSFTEEVKGRRTHFDVKVVPGQDRGLIDFGMASLGEAFANRQDRGASQFLYDENLSTNSDVNFSVYSRIPRK